MSGSRHLEEILERHNHIAPALLVDADIEKYSLRRTLAQVDAVGAFTENARKALEDVSKQYVAYAQQNDVNFETDIIRLPTGDGLIVAFTFEGLPDIHLSFARALIARVGSYNEANRCERFEADGWCNCHANHNLRIGVTEGKSIVYSDVNGSYNIAGNATNLAARVMAQADRNQILFSDSAYSQLVDLVDDPSLADRFRTFTEVSVKHGLRIAVHQYINEADEFLNTAQPAEMAIGQELDALSETLGGPFTTSVKGGDRVAQGQALLDMMKVLQSVQERLGPNPTQKGQSGADNPES